MTIKQLSFVEKSQFSTANLQQKFHIVCSVAGVGVGLAIGPPIGSVIYGIGGYMYPFMFCGLIEVILLIIAAISIPNSKAGFLQQKLIASA